MMPRLVALENRKVVAAAAAALLIGILTLLSVLAFGTPGGQTVTVLPTPTTAVSASLESASDIAGAAAAPAPTRTTPPLPTDTPEPAPTFTPVPPTDTPVVEVPPTELPVEPTAVVEAPPPPLPVAATQPPQAPAKKPPAGGTPVLPNGVRYGDRTPNLPNRIVRIASPNIKLDTKVYEVYAKKNEWEVAEYAGGHHYNSANPGDGGNIVLSGHNNWKGEVFRYLENLQPGHEIHVWTLDGKLHKYRVEETKKLKEAGATYAQRLENAGVMNPTPHEQLTLITCWPYTTFTHRIVVVAVPIQ